MSQPMKEVFAERLKAFRHKKGLSQDALATKLDVTRQSIVNYEKGLRIPDIDVLAKVVEGYECSPYYLLGLQNEMSDRYAHMTDSMGLSEDALSWLDMNRNHADVINKILTDEDFWGFIFTLSEIASGAAFIDQYDHKMPSDYIDFIKFEAHKHIEAMIETAWKQGQQNVDTEKMRQAHKEWSIQIQRYMRMGAKLRQKKEAISNEE